MAALAGPGLHVGANGNGHERPKHDGPGCEYDIPWDDGPRKGLGSVLIERALPGKANAERRTTFRLGGLLFELAFSIDELDSAGRRRHIDLVRAYSRSRRGRCPGFVFTADLDPRLGEADAVRQESLA